MAGSFLHPREYVALPMDKFLHFLCCVYRATLRNDRSKISNQSANKELRYLRSLFNWGMKKGYIASNPAFNMEMMHVEKKVVYGRLRTSQEQESIIAHKLIHSHTKSHTNLSMLRI